MTTGTFQINSKNLSSALIKYWPCILILLAFMGFISKSLYNYPVGIMAILGLFKILNAPTILYQDNILKIFTLVFLCLWLPLLISYPDAVNPEHSRHVLLPYLRFFPAGIFIIQEISKDNDRLKFIIVGLFYIVLFWCIDASIQFAFGKNLLGFPYQAGHITGMFYPRNTISHICSILSGFYFFYIYLYMIKNKWLLFSLIPLFFIILLSGRRAAWIMLALSSFGFLIYGYLYSVDKKKFITLFSVVATLITLTLTSTIVFHKATNHRFKVTLGLFNNDYDSINQATAIRLPIWETAYTIFKANPVNGIGPRGFRHVYKDYAAADDYFVEQNIIPTQPHLLILEVLAETGVIGFMGYLFAIFISIGILIKSNNKKTLLPFFIPVTVALFPFNAHMAIYGSIWSSMIWLLMALYFGNVKLTKVDSDFKIINEGFNY